MKITVTIETRCEGLRRNRQIRVTGDGDDSKLFMTQSGSEAFGPSDDLKRQAALIISELQRALEDVKVQLGREGLL